MGLSLSPVTVVVLLFVGAVAWVATMVRLQTARWIFGFMIFISGTGLMMEGTVRVQSWLLPIQENRAELILGCGLVLVASFIGLSGRISMQNIPMQGWFLLAIGLLQGVLRIIHEGLSDGAMSMGFTLATVLPVAIILPSLLQRREDWFTLLRLPMWVNIAYLGACVVELFYNADRLTVTVQNRFCGISLGPINAAMFLSISAVIALWLFNHDPRKSYKLLWKCLVGINIALALGTGSRTAVLILTVGIAAVMFRRMGRTVLLLPIGALTVLGALQLIRMMGLDLGVERVVSLTNTRSYAWQVLFAQGMQSPLIGNGIDNQGGVQMSENSYLYGFAAFGLPMVFLLIAFLLASMSYCLRLMRTARLHPKWQPIVDIIITFNMLYFGLSIIDGSLLSRIETQLMLMLLFSTLAGAFLKHVSSGAAELEDEEEGWDEWEEMPETGMAPA